MINVRDISWDYRRKERIGSRDNVMKCQSKLIREIGFPWIRHHGIMETFISISDSRLLYSFMLIFYLKQKKISILDFKGTVVKRTWSSINGESGNYVFSLFNRGNGREGNQGRKGMTREENQGRRGMKTKKN